MKEQFLTKILIASLIPAASLLASSNAIAGKLIYEIEAKNARLVRNVTGPVVASIDGVPAEPVDSFVWSGVGTTKINGQLKLKIDTVHNTGEIHAEWEDRNGHWTYHQTTFTAPGHPTGARVGPSVNDIALINNDPVTTNVYLHGDSGAAAPVIPTVLNLLATWGPAEITHNGIPFDNPYDGPVPNWAGHTMTTEGIRGKDGSVRTTTGEIYNPSQAAKGAIDHNDLEFHLVFHDAPGPKTANFPPPLSFFYHITFEDVKINIKQ
ncbi:MAG: hypothetical protein ACC657_13055 [Thiohalomonadales bacterium]